MAVSGSTYQNAIYAQMALPLDAKSYADNLSQLRDPDHWGELGSDELPYISDGMIFVTKDKHVYQLLDRTNYTSESAWKEIGVGGTGGNGESIDINKYGKYTAIALYGVNGFGDPKYNGIQGLVNSIKDYHSSEIIDVVVDDVYKFSKERINAYNIHLCCIPHNIYDLTSDVEIKISGTFGDYTPLNINTVRRDPFTDINISSIINDNYAGFSDNYNLNSLDIFCNKPFIVDLGAKPSGLLNWIEL